MVVVISLRFLGLVGDGVVHQNVGVGVDHSLSLSSSISGSGSGSGSCMEGVHADAGIREKVCGWLLWSIGTGAPFSENKNSSRIGLLNHVKGMHTCTKQKQLICP